METVDLDYIGHLLEDEEEDYIGHLLEDEEDKPWEISNDQSADWAIGKVLEEYAERDRLIALADAKIAELNEAKRNIRERSEGRNAYLTSALQAYFQTVKTRDTKTMRKYQLITGTLVLKRQQPEYVLDETTMLDWARENKPDCIKVTETINWGELKKQTTLAGESVLLAETGEVIPGVVAKERPDEFIIEGGKNE